MSVEGDLPLAQRRPLPAKLRRCARPAPRHSLELLSARRVVRGANWILPKRAELASTEHEAGATARGSVLASSETTRKKAPGGRGLFCVTCGLGGGIARDGHCYRCFLCYQRRVRRVVPANPIIFYLWSSDFFPRRVEQASCACALALPAVA